MAPAAARGEAERKQNGEEPVVPCGCAPPIAQPESEPGFEMVTPPSAVLPSSAGTVPLNPVAPSFVMARISVPS